MGPLLRASLVLLLLHAPAASPAAADPAAPRRHTPVERHRMLHDHLARRAAELTRNVLHDVRDPAAWERRRPEVRARLLHALGLDPPPPRTPLAAAVTGRIERDGYRIEKVVFQSLPRLYVTGNLYVPDRLPGRVPAVIYLSGHAPGPDGAKVAYEHHGVRLARQGYVALVLDTLEFGEVPGVHHGTHDLEMWWWQSLGYTPAGPEVWNAMRAVDYLETRPEVDRTRIGVTGISGGGSITWYAAALDERLAAAASSLGTWTAGPHVAHALLDENCDCNYFPNASGDDLPTFGALVAPRPLQILGAARDRALPPEGYREAHARTRPIYELLGAGDRLSLFEIDARHEDLPALREEATAWLARWLGPGAAPRGPTAPHVPEPPGALRVLDEPPADAINASLHRLFVKAHEPRPPRTRRAWQARRQEILTALDDKVLRAFPRARVAFQPAKEPQKLWTRLYAEAFDLELTTEEGIRVAAELFLPRAGPPARRALVYLKGAGDIVSRVDHDPLLPLLGREVVLVVRPRGTEETGETRAERAALRRTAALVGATLESMQLWDLLRSVDYLVEGEGLALDEIAVYGRREMGALALYAAALDPRITRVILDDPPASHWHGPALLNVLRITDLPEAAALVAPREIVSLTPLPAGYALTTSVYRLLGRPDRLRRAGDLGQAMRPPPGRGLVRP